MLNIYSFRPQKYNLFPNIDARPRHFFMFSAKTNHLDKQKREFLSDHIYMIVDKIMYLCSMIFQRPTLLMDF